MGYDSTNANVSARFVDPVAIAGFYNLNGSMLVSCPAAFAIPGRAWCIAPCEPANACLGGNACATGYDSQPPNYRCSNCASGYYKQAATCVKCPDSPAAVFIVFILIVVAVGGLGFVLSKKGVNIAVASIGVDYFQVLAIFSQANITWPAAIKSLFNILSAFNLNIEIVAPECLIPNVSFVQKWAFILCLPVVVGALFAVLYGWFWFWKAVVKGAPKTKWHTHLPVLVQSELVMIYFLYLYITRTLLDVFNCAPTVPPDGNTYLQAVPLEKCGVPGGVQMTLLPVAIAGIMLYSVGYPLALGWKLYANRELIMEDQLLRAKGTGEDRLTNPHAYEFRKMFSRAYFQFRPDYCLWIVMILTRKFCIVSIGWRWAQFILSPDGRRGVLQSNITAHLHSPRVCAVRRGGHREQERQLPDGECGPVPPVCVGV